MPSLQEKRNFIEHSFVALLKNGNPQSTALWGRMSYQQMVEHMVLIFKNANGSLPSNKIITPEDKLPALRAFIYSDKELKENTKSPALPDEPLPLRYPSLEAALDKLEKEIQGFLQVYDETPELTILNPVFGYLSYEDAIHFQYKHTRHHARQFGLL
ncbi:MAG: hypothetical protein SFU21_17065 [Flavihumibacter sp.]|nr:hypothetical protein [Flavihumibacter sp.]